SIETFAELTKETTSIKTYKNCSSTRY
ncbi:unnamed protein product, partial [Rotaria sp. Silwood2]